MDLVFAPSQVESWPIARLRPYARNAKIHGDDQVAKIAASMAKFGWTVPCMVADDGELIAGHGRVLAATMLGLTEVPNSQTRPPPRPITTAFTGSKARVVVATSSPPITRSGGVLAIRCPKLPCRRGIAMIPSNPPRYRGISPNAGFRP